MRIGGHLLAPADVLDDGGNAITPLHDARQRAVPHHTFLKTLAGNTPSPPVIPTASSRRSHVVLEGCEEALKAETSLPALRRNSEREREPLRGGTRQCGQDAAQPRPETWERKRENQGSREKLAAQWKGKHRETWPGKQRCSPSVTSSSAAWANGTNVQSKQFRLAVGLRGADEDQERVDRRVDNRATPTQSGRGNPYSVNGRFVVHEKISTSRKSVVQQDCEKLGSGTKIWMKQGWREDAAAESGKPSFAPC
ncbi:hypothetical protein C8J57DRAFT_1249976 [Mycena rebaudengoi]|nr:hypothetical protein C8J57DRAFT_1249976 [Mycena rebaudengoi]